MPRLAYICALSMLIFFSCKNENGHVASQESMDPTQAILAYKAKAQLGEGAFWNHETQTFYWIDIEGKKLHIYNPETSSNKSFNMPSRIGTVVPRSANEAIVALEDGIYIVNTNNREVTPFVSIEKDLTDNRFNDGKCDPAGRFWIGSMHMPQTEAAGTVYMVSDDKSVTPKINNVTISNGIVWTKDHKTMYYIDTPTGHIRGYDYDLTTGNISNERIAVTVPGSLGFPDGMAIDEEDKLWVGLWNGNQVARFDPISGQLISSITVPAHNVTACAFGGPNLDTLYITTATVDMTDAELDSLPDAGSIFKAVPGVRGVKSNLFADGK